MSKRWWFVAAVLAASVAGAEEEEVKGDGFARSRQPPETSDPPDSWTSEDEAHDPEEGVAFAGIHDYALKQGAHDDDKSAWSDTDYIHWAVHGATLVARGQVQDSRSDAATVATSEAWGGERIEVEIAAEEGSGGHIRAHNRIAFEYDYSISGPKIGEAGVGLLATAWDLKGNAHPFSLSAIVGESVTEEVDRRSGVRVQGTESSGGGFGASTKDGFSLSIGGESSHETEAESERGFHVSRRFAQADGDSGNTPAIEESDFVSGATPLRRVYNVWSDGFVRLVARSADDASTTVVQLHRFKVVNHLTAWREIYAETEGPDGEGNPGGPTTGGDDDPPPPTTPDDDPSGPTTPGDPDEPGDEPGDPAPGGGGGGGWVQWSDTFVAAGLEPSRGIGAERGGWRGTVTARLAAARATDTLFSVTSTPAGALAIATQLTVPAGHTLGALPYRALAAGPATVTLRALDEGGAPSGEPLALDLDPRSLEDFATPDVWLALDGMPWRPGGDAVARCVPGEDVGPLHVGRTGFAGLDDEASVVSIAVDDPEGILPGLPALVTIPAGSLSEALPLALGPACGRAVVTATCGDRSATLTVVSEAPAWRTVPRIVVPVGAEAAVPYLVDRPARAMRLVVAGSGAPGCVAVEAESVLYPHEGCWYARAWGMAPGTSTVTLRSEGLPDLETVVEVVPERVAVVGSRLELYGLDGAQGTVLHLAAPPGLRFASLDPPAAAADYLEIEGLGTAQLELTLLPSAEMPSDLSLPSAFEGAAEGPLRIDVYETRDDPDTPMRTNSYRIDAR